MATVSEALRPFFQKQRSKALAATLEEQLVDYLGHRGLAADEVAGRRVIVAPVDSLDPDLAWSFVAVHLLTHLPAPVRELESVGRLFSRALADLGARGLHPQAEAAGDAALAAVGELSRLDALARGLRARLQGERPGRELYERDPAAYAAAMRSWEAERPVADQELEGGFEVTSVRTEGLVLRHSKQPEPIELSLDGSLTDLTRPNDRVDAILGSRHGRWFVMDVFAAVAPRRPDVP